MADTFSGQAAVLKEYYTQKRIQRMVYERGALLAMLRKNTEVEGETYDIPIVTAYSQGGSSSFSEAKANKGETSTTKFQVPPVDEYGLASFERKLLKATRSNLGGFFKNHGKLKMDGAIHNVTSSLGMQAYGDGTGSRGLIGTSGVSGATVTLSSARDAVKFELGMYVQFADPSGPTIRASGVKDKITGINRVTGVLTFGTNIATTWSGDVPQDADLVLRSGDLSNVISGLQAYLPQSATPAALHGVTRTADVTALGGVYADLSGLSPLESVIVGQSQVCEIGGGLPDHAFCHNSFFRSLVRELGGKSVIEELQVNSGMVTVSFSSVVVRGDEGPVRVVPDRYCPATKLPILQLDSWELGSLDLLPDIFDRDTEQEMLREADSDTYEVRVGGYGNMVCDAPGHNGMFTVDAGT